MRARQKKTTTNKAANEQRPIPTGIMLALFISNIVMQQVQETASTPTELIDQFSSGSAVFEVENHLIMALKISTLGHYWLTLKCRCCSLSRSAAVAWLSVEYNGGQLWTHLLAKQWRISSGC